MTAPAELVIEVSAEDIANGIPTAACSCPVALAVHRLLGPGEVTVTADAHGAWIEADGSTWVLLDPGHRFIELFDDGLPVQPGTFTATLVSAL